MNSCEGRQRGKCGLCQLFLFMLPASAVFSSTIFIHAVCLCCGMHLMLWQICLTTRWSRASLLLTAGYVAVYVISNLTGTYTQHRDSHHFFPCNLMSESIINLVTAVLCVLCYYSVSKHRFFLVSMSGYILFYTSSVKLPPVLNIVRPIYDVRVFVTEFVLIK